MPCTWHRGMRPAASLLLIGGVLMLTAGCQQPQAKPKIGPTQAIWVTRSDYRTAEDVTRIVNNCADAGFNTVLFQVRGNGTAFYQSNFEPWDDAFRGVDPGFDPLTVACTQAHARGVELHAWVNVMPAWRGTKPPANPEQLYNKHPEWFWYDQNGNRQALSSFYVSLNPCWPEVRQYLVDVFRDIVSRYDVDGLHLDYIRFPNEPPAIPKGSGLDYPRDERTLALYKAETGLTPDEDAAAWKNWRTEQVTTLMGQIHEMMRKTKPQAVLSSAAGSVPDRALAHFQDAPAWITRGLVDAVYLMNYTGDPQTFRSRLDAWLPLQDQAVIVPGLWFDGKLGVEEGIAAARQEIESAVECTGHYCIFAYSSLFDTRAEDLGDVDVGKRGRPQQRLEALRDLLLEIRGSTP